MASTDTQNTGADRLLGPFRPLVQIAGVHDVEEAQLLCACGVDWLGFPLRLPVHREDLSDDEAAVVICRCALRDRGVLITYLDRGADIAVLCRSLGVYRVQIHGEIDPEEVDRLRELLPGAFVMKSLVVHPDNPAGLETLTERFSARVDAFITDTFDPVTGASGATGKTHDWAVSRRLVALSPKPVILAGGLTPDNVRQAVECVRPAGVDAHTGVEGADGRKDPLLVRRFVAEAHRGFAGSSG
jgi:phosphoribosylanthranilate isomerase